MRLHIISKLAYSWTGWPRDRAVPELLPTEILQSLKQQWKSDGLLLVDSRWSAKRSQMTVLSTPSIRPVDITRLVKGRLVHSLRKNGYRNCFRRKVSLRSLGDNSTETVRKYVATQLDRSDLADTRYISQLKALKYSNGNISLNHPQVVTHGRYWINLHIVLVVAGRYRIRGRNLLNQIYQTTIDWGVETLNHAKIPAFSPAIESFSIMPDHVHIVIRAPIDRNPQFLLETLWQASNTAAGFLLYSDEVYVGTFSEYSIGAISKVVW